MIKYLFKIAIRNLAKHKIYSTINIVGLSIGFTAFILISLFINYEFNWDKHNKNYNRIYRVQVRIALSGKQETWSQTPPRIANYLKEQFPEFEKTLLLRETWGEYLSSDNQKQFFEEDGYYTDSTIFDVFTYSFIRGDCKTALLEPFSIVLSKSLAEKLYGSVNCLGKTLMVEKKFSLKVSGVYEDLPKNSHIRPSYLIPIVSFGKMQNWPDFYNWGTYSFRNYVLLKKNTNPKLIDNKIANIINDNTHDPVKTKLYLNPLSKLYIMPEDKNDFLVVIGIYGMVAIFILLLASFNYINLSTANSSLRAKEIGIRKVSGSGKAQLISQFLCESLAIAFIAIILAFFLSELTLPLFNKTVDRELTLSYIKDWKFVLKMISITLLVGLISGIYPAILISSHNISDLFRNNIFKRKHENINIKKILVTAQFIIAVFLIINSIAMSRQISFMMNKDLGFDKENLLFARIKSPQQKLNFEDIRNRLLKHPEIIDACISENIPLNGSDGFDPDWEGSPSDERINCRYNTVSYDFDNTFKLEVILGRDFSRDYKMDAGKSCLINETAWKRFGWKDPIGKRLSNSRFQVIGVVKDFHLYSIHEKIPPLVIELNNSLIEGSWIYSFRVVPGKLKIAEKIINEELESYFPTDPFDLYIFSEFFKKDGTFKIYNSINVTFIFFAILTVLLSIIGLLGLVSFTAKRKTKEIGIRKVHGSSIAEIFLKLTSEYIILVFIAALIACPASYYFFQKTLPTAYKAAMQLWEFIAATSIVLLITILATSFNSIKAAFTNPVEALRYE